MGRIIRCETKGHKNLPQTVIAGLTRNPLSDYDILPRRRWRMFLRHDGKKH